MLTSGKVPLEKTLKSAQISYCLEDDQTSRAVELAQIVAEKNSHQEAGLSASTITDNNKFAADFGHLGYARTTRQYRLLRQMSRSGRVRQRWREASERDLVDDLWGWEIDRGSRRKIQSLRSETYFWQPGGCWRRRVAHSLRAFTLVR